MDTLSYTLDFCAKANVPVMLDPAPAAALPEAVWSQVAWFTPNETEAAFYVGEGASAEESAQALAGQRACAAWCSSAAARARMLPSPAEKPNG